MTLRPQRRNSANQIFRSDVITSLIRFPGVRVGRQMENNFWTLQPTESATGHQITLDWNDGIRFEMPHATLAKRIIVFPHQTAEIRSRLLSPQLRCQTPPDETRCSRYDNHGNDLELAGC